MKANKRCKKILTRLFQNGLPKRHVNRSRDMADESIERILTRSDGAVPSMGKWSAPELRKPNVFVVRKNVCKRRFQ